MDGPGTLGGDDLDDEIQTLWMTLKVSLDRLRRIMVGRGIDFAGMDRASMADEGAPAELTPAERRRVAKVRRRATEDDRAAD